MGKQHGRQEGSSGREGPKLQQQLQDLQQQLQTKTSEFDMERSGLLARQVKLQQELTRAKEELKYLPELVEATRYWEGVAKSAQQQLEGMERELNELRSKVQVQEQVESSLKLAHIRIAELLQEARAMEGSKNDAIQQMRKCEETARMLRDKLASLQPKRLVDTELFFDDSDITGEDDLLPLTGMKRRREDSREGSSVFAELQSQAKYWEERCMQAEGKRDLARAALAGYEERLPAPEATIASMQAQLLRQQDTIRSQNSSICCLKAEVARMCAAVKEADATAEEALQQAADQEAAKDGALAWAQYFQSQAQYYKAQFKGTEDIALTVASCMPLPDQMVDMTDDNSSIASQEFFDTTSVSSAEYMASKTIVITSSEACSANASHTTCSSMPAIAQASRSTDTAALASSGCCAEEPAAAFQQPICMASLCTEATTEMKGGYIMGAVKLGAKIISFGLSTTSSITRMAGRTLLASVKMPGQFCFM